MNQQKTLQPARENTKISTAPPIVREPETGGAKGPEPTRYGDWEKNGRVSDF